MATIEEELTKTKKELAELTEDYQDFVYAVSHDLNAPLRHIEGFSRLIYETNSIHFDDKTKNHFAFISKGVEQGKEILDALLTLSRLNKHAQPFSLIDCNQMMVEVKDSMHDSIQKSNAQINCSDMPKIMGDASQLCMVFSHLLKNALLYQSGNTQPKVEIAALEKEHFWQFSCKDNGLGIRDSIAKEIFKPLKRGVSDEYSGQGMGLTLARKIVKRHGGDIWLDTQVEQGAVFYFTIAKEHNHE